MMMIMTMFLLTIKRAKRKKKGTELLQLPFTVNGSALHSIHFHDIEILLFFYCVHNFPIRRENSKNKLVYIFINEEIYILCLLMNSFSCDIKNVFLCLQLHIQTLNVSTNGQCSLLCVSSKSGQIFLAVFLL